MGEKKWFPEPSCVRFIQRLKVLEPGVRLPIRVPQSVLLIQREGRVICMCVAALLLLT